MCLLKLELGLNDLPTKINMIICPASMLSAMQSSTAEHCFPSCSCRNTVSGAHPHWEDGLQRDLLLVSVTKDGKSTTGRKTSSYIFLEMSVSENAMHSVTAQPRYWDLA